MSQAPATNPYLRTKILTASPEELRLMLYDGAIKFAQQGRAALEGNRFEDGHHALMRAQKIVLELSTSLDHKVAPDLTEKLAALYTYIYKLLVDANTGHETQPLDEAVKLLQYERETWVMLMNKLRDEGVGGTPSDPAVTGAQQTAISAYSRSA